MEKQTQKLESSLVEKLKELNTRKNELIINAGQLHLDIKQLNTVLSVVETEFDNTNKELKDALKAGDLEKVKRIFNMSSLLHWGIAVLVFILLEGAGYFFFRAFAERQYDRHDRFAAKLFAACQFDGRIRCGAG